QDNWQVTRRLTLNLGLRTEREFLPSFRTDSGIKSRAIEFGFSDKMAPRLGFALDVTGTGKFKISGFWGMFYDMMKYEMPRGSFGGDQWKDYVHALDDPDFTKIKTGNTPGRLFETVDWRIPSNDPSDNTIDPKLKPMRVISMDWAADYRVTNNVVLSARYVHKRLTRTIEDVGILTPQGEKYFIANPGFGLTADPKTWGPGIPVTPKAKRDYDGLEIRVDKRYSKGYQITSSYTYSRLYGNYSGLASSDENGRTSPNVNRYFDLPFMSYDGHGKLVEGLLATDRPHTFKFFGAKDFKSKLGTTTFSPIFTWFTGTPITSETGVFGVPVFYDGRGDLGRTPVVTETNLLVAHEWKMPKHERQRLRFELNFLNLFNQSTITNRDTSFVHPNDGGLQFDNEADFFKGFDRAKEMKAQDLRKSPSLGFANGFHGPRVIRFGIQYFF
ncbi:MAG: hypothetical protein HY013_03810, partial [Candidatus Solibacter usitatus]|nr:hypothetical protein [Candidatus Solibacter usitatus]